MLQIDALIEGRGMPTCVHLTDSVRSAVKKMYENDYSQLPVLDEREHAVGLFTELALTQMFAFEEPTEFLDNAVEQWMQRPAVVVGPSRSLHDVADMLANTSAVIVGKENKIIGIVTDYDIAVFIARWSHGLSLVEDIERRLRGYIERLFPTENALHAGLIWAFGLDKQNEHEPAKEYESLTLREHYQLITTDKAWPRFEPYFKSKKSFMMIMNEAMPIRNQIAHFRAEPTKAQMQTLKLVQNWLARCPLVPEQEASHVIEIATTDTPKGADS